MPLQHSDSPRAHSGHPPRKTRPLRRGIAGVAASAVALLCSSVALAQSTTPAAQTTLPRTTLTAGMYRLDVQVASTPQEREIGLMYRDSMPEYEGMLFVFEVPGVQCFWMKNTRIPLTAAFLADDGRIVNLADMQPFDEQSHCSARPVRFVLEMNQGWFAQHHLQDGDSLHGAPFSPAHRPDAPQ